MLTNARLVINVLRRPNTTLNAVARRFSSSDQQQQQQSNASNTNSTNSGRRDLREEVIDLYKNLIYLSREWPTDLRPQIKRGFMKNKDVQDPEEIRKLIARGEYISREITATYHLRKYRAMKRRYYSDTREKELDEMFKTLSYWVQYYTIGSASDSD